jgi:transcriptional regulator with XRE-family HTH domain
MDSSVATRLKAAREQAGLSQGQVARMLEMHRPTISEIEAGRRKVSVDELKAFAGVYGVSVSWLADTEDGEELSPRAQLAARELAKLKREDLDRVLALLASLRTEENTSDE